MINPNLNVKSLRQQFIKDDRVRIENFLAPGQIEEIQKEVESATFELVYVLDGRMQTTSKDKMDAMSVEQTRWSFRSTESPRRSPEHRGRLR